MVGSAWLIASLALTGVATVLLGIALNDLPAGLLQLQAA